MDRDELWAQAQWGDLYVPSLVADYPSGLQGRALNRVERGVARWPASVADTRFNAVDVDVEDPLSDEIIEITRARWGSDVRLHFAPGSRMIEQ